MTITTPDNRTSFLETTRPKPDGGIPSRSPVFILGIMERCGSNFLSDIVSINPDFELPAVLGEDYMMEHAHLLLEYADRTAERWSQMRWISNPEECRTTLLRHLGDGILAFLYQQIAKDKRLLAKTPAAYNVDKFLNLFPDAKLLILIRDGRDSVESAARTWPSLSYEYWIKQWAQGAQSILKFIEAGRDLRGRCWELIRYEDLLEKPEEAVSSILNLIGIDPGAFDWNRLKRLPVHGSSQYRSAGGDVTGRKVEKSDDFKPLGRWNSWTWRRKRAFKKIAGQELIALGYVANNRW